MRPLRCFFLFVLLAFGLFAGSTVQAQSREGNAVPSPNAIVYVDGLACPFCAYGLEKKMKKLDALRTMEVQIEKGRVLLAFKEGRTLTKKQIQDAVKNAGFTARTIEFPERDDTGR